MQTINVLDLVTEYKDEKEPDRKAYYTLPETFLPTAGERICKFLDTESRPEGVLGSYYDAFLKAGGPDVIKKALVVTHPDAMKMDYTESQNRDGILELIRLWFTEELLAQCGGEKIKLWIKIGPESWRYKLIHS
jgi:hypothetical protein